MQKEKSGRKRKRRKANKKKVGRSENWTGNLWLWTVRLRAWWRDPELHLETGNQYWKPRKHGTTSVTKWRIAQSCIFPGCCCIKCRPIQDEVSGKSYFLYLLKIWRSVWVPLSILLILRPIQVSLSDLTPDSQSGPTFVPASKWMHRLIA